MPGVGHDLQVFHRRDETLVLFREIPIVAKWQCGFGFLEQVQGVL